MDAQSRNGLIIAGVLLVLAAAAWLVFPRWRNANPPPAATLTAAEQQKEETQSVAVKAIQAGDDISQCGTITDAIQANICRLYVIDTEAQQKNDVTICEKLADPGLKENCADQFYTVQALNTKNATWCSKVVNSIRRTQCLGYLSSK